MRLTVASESFNSSEQTGFYKRIAEPVSQAESGRTAKSCVTYIGFANDEFKRRVFIESDCVCFPTYYHAGSFGLVVVKAIAFGLPVATTCWLSLLEMLPSGYPGLGALKPPNQIADAQLTMMVRENGDYLREKFMNRFTLQRCLTNLADAIHSVKNARYTPSLEPVPQAF